MTSPTSPNQEPLRNPGANRSPSTTGPNVERRQIFPSSQAPPIPSNALRAVQSRGEFFQSLDTCAYHDPTITDEESYSRIIAVQKIQQCYDQRETKLSLNKLGLTSLPPNLDCLTTVKELYLNHNKFTSVTLQGLPALTKLNLNSNKLTSVTLQGLPALTNLRLNNNNLTSVTLQGLPALTHLDLTLNKLTSVTLQGLPALKILDLNDNKLTSINLQGLTALTNLNLNFNKFTSINLQGLTALTHIDLTLNKLTSFADITLPTPNALETMYVAGNPFVFLQDSNTVTMRIPSGVIQDIAEGDLRDRYRVELISPCPTGITTSLPEVLQKLQVPATPNLLAHPGAPALAKFLERMMNSWPRYDSVLRSFIHLAENNQNFRDDLFEGVISTETACHDRPLYFFSRLSVTAAAYAAEENQDPKALVQSLLALKYLDVIDAKAREACQGEALEVALYLQLQLRSRLNLPIAIDSMAFNAYATRAISAYLQNHPEEPQTVSEWVDRVATQALNLSATPEQKREILCDTPYFYKRCENDPQVERLKITYAAATTLILDPTTPLDDIISEEEMAVLGSFSSKSLRSLAKSSLPKELRETPFEDLTDAQKNESVKQLGILKEKALQQLRSELMGSQAQKLIEQAEKS